MAEAELEATDKYFDTMEKRDEMEEKCMAAEMAPQTAETMFTLMALFPALSTMFGRNVGHSVE